MPYHICICAPFFALYDVHWKHQHQNKFLVCASTLGIKLFLIVMPNTGP